MEKDTERNVIRKIETQTFVQELQATDDIENDIQQIKFEAKKEIEKMINKKLDHDINGFKVIEKKDYIKNEEYKIYDCLTEWSQFCQNGKFEKMYKIKEELGKGTFGAVYKVEKVSDKRIYAIKKIYFPVEKEKSITEHRIFKEIEALENLNHPNIVRYYQYWIEEIDPNIQNQLNLVEQQFLQSKKQLDKCQQINESISEVMSDYDDGGLIQFVGEGGESIHTESELKSQLQQDTIYSFHPSDISSEAQQSLVRKINFQPGQYSQRFVLYIEMEYCERHTLRNYIDKVNRKEEKTQIRNVFKQLVGGVAYIHSEKYIHRDLKPTNIFIDKRGEIKIGDMGLSKREIVEENLINRQISAETMGVFKNGNSQSVLTNNVGTPMYMAPEVQSSSQYGTSADIYALGIILFEMLYKFKTGHEKIRLLKELTDQQILPGNLMKQFPDESKLVLRMTKKNPETRPSAQQILMSL